MQYKSATQEKLHRVLLPGAIKIKNYIVCGLNKYNTAMRTATPFSTWWSMMEDGPSATSLSSSTPRLMGPGCMMTISLPRLSNMRRLMP